MTTRRPGRPPILTDPVDVNTRIERALADRIQAAADTNGRTLSAEIRTALTAYYADGGPR